MMEDRKKARKGTASCTECRRRKIRCIRSPEDAQACRRCEERGSECIAQTYSSQPRHVQRLPSRCRISQLESQVAGLSKAIRDIEPKLGYQPTQLPTPTSAQPGLSPGINESDDDDDSSISDVLAVDPPSHLRSLFQNDWLSVETRQNEQLQDRKAKAPVHVLDTARQALQKLIPSKGEVSHLARSASRWLGLLNTLLPQPFSVKSQQEMLESYDEMHKPDVDVISLASWLLTIAITTQQTPHEQDSAAKGYQSLSNFPRAVCDIVESTIISDDRLICTIQGLGMALHFVRLQMSQGNFQKAWLRLRHFIAIAELMELPRSFQLVQLNGDVDDEMQLQRAQVWESLCSADGLSGMIINLPPCISPFKQINIQPLTIDGVVQPRAYLRRLMSITTKIQYRDDTQGSSAELYASALELDRQLSVLMSQTPKSWWDVDAENVGPDHVVQHLHYCVRMRVHLTFAMRQGPGEECIYSRLACRDACQMVVKRYQFIRRELPSGIFISPALDLHAFTATVIILLMSHSSPSTDRLNLQTNKAEVDGLVAQVIKLMDGTAKDTTGCNFAQRGVTAIRSLNRLLRQDDTSNVQELTLKIPLLGKVHIRRNSYASRAVNPPTLQTPSNVGFRNPNEQFTPQERRLNADSHVTSSAFQAQGEWDDPLSWSIEGRYDDFFQDALMADNIDQFAMWENGTGGF